MKDERYLIIPPPSPSTRLGTLSLWFGRLTILSFVEGSKGFPIPPSDVLMTVDTRHQTLLL